MKTGRAIYAASEQCADLWYLTKLATPDPFLWLEVPAGQLVVVSPLEYGRAIKTVPSHVEVLSFAAAKRRFRTRDCRASSLIAGAGRLHQIKRWQVPPDFPCGLVSALSRRRVQVAPSKGPFLPARARKTKAEIEDIIAAQRLAESGMAAALDLLRSAKIKRGGLYLKGTAVTAELVRGEIDATISRLGGIAAHTIVAPGPQGADPHDAGHGPIAAHTPLIIDIFPRMNATGYFGDLTRTVVRGKAKKVVKRAFRAVRQARDQAKDMIKAGVDGKKVHEHVVTALAEAGFETDDKADPPRGFFHGTGHGVGLEIHESPRISRGSCKLVAGHVVTVEPGVYYPEWGGVRLEDLVVVEKKSCRTLTDCETVLEI